MAQINAAKIAKSGLWVSASFMFAKLSKFITQLFLARLLSPDDFGVWGMVLLVTTLSTLFEDSTIAGVLVQRGLDDKKLVNAVYSLGVNVSVGLFIIQALAGFLVAQFFGVPLLWPLIACTSVVYLIRAGAGSHSAVLQRQMKFRELAICNGASSLARLSSAFTCAALGGGVWSFAVGTIASATVSSSLKHWFSRYRFTYHLIPDSSAVQEVRGYISSLIGINLAVYANTNGDNFIIGKLLGAQALGFYNMAYQLAMLPGFALSRINRVNFSVLSQRDSEGQRIYVCRILELYALVSAPIHGIGFVVAPWLIPLMYGPDWTEVVPIFQIVLIFAYARIFMAILGTTLNALNKPNINAAINWVLVPLSLPTFFVGTWLGGITGVAIAVALVMGVGATVWFWIATCRAANWNLRDLLTPVLLPTLATSIAIVVVLYFPMDRYEFILEPIILLTIYGSIISIFSAGKIPIMLFQNIKNLVGIK
ncbi:MAG: oligosaccharide flippase family protein [Moorea sp. SIO1G6]|uniref:oligosaccharide flippase family protein n=1 Tax=Moorena sp. SIO1G6 TaxID=2607840 RepID=UPI0013C07064|nr:oligosaccharide flippase family protein [Moorena sp. SIO1G6]NES83004.1 oligosaccharide flippase family protein [Moorena sp. SIO2B7]NET62928.1 oligosaccharide flippase family protein [Moorena sp. SIO1G6]